MPRPSASSSAVIDFFVCRLTASNVSTRALLCIILPTSPRETELLKPVRPPPITGSTAISPSTRPGIHTRGNAANTMNARISETRKEPLTIPRNRHPNQVAAASRCNPLRTMINGAVRFVPTALVVESVVRRAAPRPRNVRRNDRSFFLRCAGR